MKKSKVILMSLLAGMTLFVSSCKDSDDTPVVPVVTVDNLPATYSYAGGTYSVPLKVENLGATDKLTAKTSDSWITLGEVTNQSVAFTLDANTGAAREGTISVMFGDKELKKLDINQDAALNLALNVDVVSFHQANITIEPSDANALYLYSLMPKGEGSDSIIGKADMEQKAMVRMIAGLKASGFTLEESADKGKLEKTVSELDFDQDYYLVAFGVSAEGAPSTPMFKKEFKTKPFSFSNPDLKITISSPEQKDISFTAAFAPAEKDKNYYFSIFSKSYYNTWMKDLGEISEHPEMWTLALKMYEDDLDKENGSKTNWYTRDVVKGDQTIEMNERFYDLKPETEYAVIAYYVDEFGYAISKPVMSDWFMTKKSEEKSTTTDPKDFKVSFQIGNLYPGTKYRYITFTPTNFEQLYIYAQMPKVDYDKRGEEGFIKYVTEEGGKTFMSEATGKFEEPADFSYGTKISFALAVEKQEDGKFKALSPLSKIFYTCDGSGNYEIIEPASRATVKMYKRSAKHFLYKKF